MKQKTNHVAIPARFGVLMLAFLAIIFFANANLSFAASGKAKSSAVVRTSAVEYTEAQIKQLQGALNITEAQKELWNNLTQVMRENAKEMDAFSDARVKERSEGTKTLNAVERMKFHSQITKTQLDQLEKLIPPFEAFYSGMSDQQKNITDIIFRTGKHQKSKRK
jgi:hypothetical protein